MTVLDTICQDKDKSSLHFLLNKIPCSDQSCLHNFVVKSIQQYYSEKWNTDNPRICFYQSYLIFFTFNKWVITKSHNPNYYTSNKHSIIIWSNHAFVKWHHGFWRSSNTMVDHGHRQWLTMVMDHNRLWSTVIDQSRSWATVNSLYI